jgi:type IV pilus assembly protein PilO
MAIIPEDPKKRNTLLAVIGSLALVYLFHSFVYGPKKEEAGELEARLEQLQDRNRRARTLAVGGTPELEERLATYERHLVQLEQLIPQREEVPALLASMATEARRTNVDLALMRPDLASMQTEPADSTVIYSKQVYELGVVGEYHDIGRFLAAIASLQRIVTPTNLELTPYQGVEEMTEAEAPVEARFRIQTYIVPESRGGSLETLEEEVGGA